MTTAADLIVPRVTTPAGWQVSAGGGQVVASKDGDRAVLTPLGWQAWDSGREWLADYDVNPAAPYGRVFRDRTPPGLTYRHRPCSVPGAAVNAIRDASERALPGDSDFSRTMLALAENESGQAFGRPANVFNALPADRRGDDRLITAWGCFQFNRGAWERLGRPGPSQVDESLRIVTIPPELLGETWQCTQQTEIAAPVRWYSRLYKQARLDGADPYRATMSVWLHHSGPAYYSAFRRAGFVADRDRFIMANSLQNQAGAVDRWQKATGKAREQYGV